MCCIPVFNIDTYLSRPG